MKQTKKKSQKSAKQPIKVVLSKDDLKELLTVLKNFIVEELLCYHKQDTQRFINLEIGQACTGAKIRDLNARETSRWVSNCPHFGSGRFTQVTYSETGAVISIDYECKMCGKKYFKYPSGLARKEKRALRKLGVKI